MRRIYYGGLVSSQSRCDASIFSYSSLLSIQSLLSEQELDVHPIVHLVLFSSLNRHQCILEIHDGTLQAHRITGQHRILRLLRLLLLLLLCLALSLPALQHLLLHYLILLMLQLLALCRLMRAHLVPHLHGLVALC